MRPSLTCGRRCIRFIAVQPIRIISSWSSAQRQTGASDGSLIALGLTRSPTRIGVESEPSCCAECWIVPRLMLGNGSRVLSTPTGPRYDETLYAGATATHWHGIGGGSLLPIPQSTLRMQLGMCSSAALTDAPGPGSSEIPKV